MMDSTILGYASHFLFWTKFFFLRFHVILVSLVKFAAIIFNLTSLLWSFVVGQVMVNISSKNIRLFISYSKICVRFAREKRWGTIKFAPFIISHTQLIIVYQLFRNSSWGPVCKIHMFDCTCIYTYVHICTCTYVHKLNKCVHMTE